MRNRPLLQLAVIGVVAAIVGTGLALLVDWFPTQGSEEASQIDTLYDVLLAVSMPIFVLVMTVAIYSVVKFRARPGDTGDGPPIHGNTKLEIIWVTIPFLLVTSLAVYGWIVLEDIEEPSSDALVVEVTGEQFTWSFAYPDEGGGEPVRSNELMLPLDRQVDFKINTEDVIHSFWVPAFRLKSDTVPGITTEIRVTPSEEGTYDVVCAELCGIGHSTMRQSVTVLPAEEFDGWLADEQRALAAEGGGEAEIPEDQSPSGVAAQEPAPAPADGGGAEADQGGAKQEGGPAGGGREAAASGAEEGKPGSGDEAGGGPGGSPSGGSAGESSGGGDRRRG
jgi:cytochrome c oxidase subunit 2